jgi:tripeptidyl-peptidase-1
MLKTTAAFLTVVGTLGDNPVIHPPQNVPAGWERTGENADTTGHMEVLVGLRRSNVDKLEKLLVESSTPGSKGYLNHASWKEMGDMVRPSEAAMGAVIGMLASNGGTGIHVAAHGDYIGASVPMQNLEKLTSGRFQTFLHGASGRRIVRLTDGVKLPPAVARHVETFTGLHGFPLDAAIKADVNATGDVTPAVINKVYNIGKVAKSTASGGKQNVQAIGQFQGQYVKPSDLSSFCKNYDSSADCSIAKFVGKNTPTRPGVESMLDTEYIMGLGQGTPTWVYSYPGFDFCGDLLTWASDVAGEAAHPYVVSLSYGSQKIDYCDKATTTRLSQDVQKLGAMGVTVVIASGDDGSGGISRQGSNNGKLSPSFPASIPYALAVGSTFFDAGLSGEEKATTQFGSGGGFSYDFPVPSYQSSAVKGYLAQNPKTGTKAYATNGRGSPDVALLGEKFAVIDNGRTMAVGGTSASTPSWGAVISLLNEECLASSAGTKTLGFVNPLFYQNPDAFTDITQGSNAIGENAASGWKCTKGWDAATGLGTPAFGKLQAVVKKACGTASVVV